MEVLWFLCLILAFIAYGITSIVLFIVDCVKAKRQQRKVKTGIKVMFITGIISIVTVIAFFVFLMILSMAVAYHM